jgi:hypothetical protein
MESSKSFLAQFSNILYLIGIILFIPVYLTTIDRYYPWLPYIFMIYFVIIVLSPFAAFFSFFLRSNWDTILNDHFQAFMIAYKWTALIFFGLSLVVGFLIPQLGVLPAILTSQVCHVPIFALLLACSYYVNKKA